MPTFAPPSDGTTKVTAVGASSPITSTGGTTPAIGISPATTAAAGSMSATDKLKIDSVAFGAQVNSVVSVAGKTGAVTLTASDVSGAVSSVSGTAPIVSSGGTTPAISITPATDAAAGSMSAADKEKIDFITVTDDVTLDRLADAIYVTDYMADPADDLGAAIVLAQAAAYAAAERVAPTVWANVSTMIKSGTTVTVTTSGAHGMATGDFVAFRDANEAVYNNIFEVTYIGSTSFSIQVDSGESDPTGTIQWREAYGGSIGRTWPKWVVIPPGEYVMETVAELKNASAMTVNIWAYGALIKKSPLFPDGRRMIEIGIPSGGVPTEAADWYTSQPFFLDIRGATFRDFDYGVQLGFASANVNLGRMQMVDCDFIGNAYATSEAVRGYNRSASVHFVRCQWDNCRVSYENQSVDRCYIDAPRIQAKEYLDNADRRAFEAQYILRRGSMYTNLGTFNPSLNVPDDIVSKPMGWYLAQDFDDWASGTDYNRGDIVWADGGEGDISVTSITRSGSTATVTTATAHELMTGDRVIIEGANEADYNGTFEVTVNIDGTPTTQFTIEVENTPTTPATGTITSRRMQLWVCNTGNGGPSDLGMHTSSPAFTTDQATHWIQIDTAKEGTLSVWSDVVVENSLFGGEAGGFNAIIWNVRADEGWSSSGNTVTYPKTARVANCQIGSNTQNGTGAFRLSTVAAINNSSLTSSGTLATFVASAAHGLVTHDVVTISGANESAYNGKFKVTVTDSTTFTYTMASDPVDTATGTPVGRKETRVSPTVLMVQVPNRLEVINNKYSFTQQVAADYWGNQDEPTIWTPTRYKPLEAVIHGNHGAAQSNRYVLGGNWFNYGPDYCPTEIVVPTYTTSGTSIYIPTGAKAVKTAFGSNQTIYGFYNISNGQVFTVICDANTDIYNSSGYIKLATGGSPFAPSSGGAITFVVVDDVAHEISRVSY